MQHHKGSLEGVQGPTNDPRRGPRAGRSHTGRGDFGLLVLDTSRLEAETDELNSTRARCHALLKLQPSTLNSWENALSILVLLMLPDRILLFGI